MSKIKSHLYELYLEAEFKNGSLPWDVLTEEEFYEQYESKEKK